MFILGTLLLNVCQVHCCKPFTDISACGSLGNSDLCTPIIAESAPTVCGGGKNVWNIFSFKIYVKLQLREQTQQKIDKKNLIQMPKKNPTIFIDPKTVMQLIIHRLSTCQWCKQNKL